MRIQKLPTEYLDSPRFKPKIKASGAESWARGDSLWLSEFRMRSSMGSPFQVEPEELAKGIPLAQAIEGTQKDWDLPTSSATQENLQLLAQGKARVVVTGQQPGLFGGPLYTLFKAISAISFANYLSQKDGIPTVPVFWVAGEDHDLDEIRQAHFYDFRSEQKLTVVYQGENDRRSVSQYPFDEERVGVWNELEGFIRDCPYSELIIKLLNDLKEGTQLASSFSVLLQSVLSPFGLLIFSSESMRELAVPIVRSCLEAPEDVLQAIERGRQKVQKLGFKPQVQGRFPLFLLSDDPIPKRHHLSPIEDGFQVDGTSIKYSRDELLRILAEQPYCFSPGALLRPLIQETIMPVACVIGGAAELAYYSQIDPLFDLLKVRKSLILPRFHGTIVDQRTSKAIDKLGSQAEFESLLIASNSAEDLVPPSSKLKSFEGEAQSLARETQAQFESLVDRIFDQVNVPPQQIEKLRRAGEKLHKEIERLGNRGGRLLRGSDQEKLRIGEMIWNTFYPEGSLQERKYCGLQFIAQFGVDWIENLIEYLSKNPNDPSHYLLFLK